MEGDQLEMAHPACNFIRHTLTIFLPLLFRARMPKRGDSCKRKAARAGLDCLYKKRNKFIFWQIVIPLSLHACSDAFSFFSRLTSAPPGMPSTSPYTPLTTRSSFILTVCTEFPSLILPYYGYGTDPSYSK